MLRMHKLHIKGWCQHRDLELSFGGSATAIVGPNGAGKSNAVNAGFTLLTGKAIVGALEDNIHYEEEKAVLSGLFSFNGRMFSVERIFGSEFEDPAKGAAGGRKELKKTARVDLSPGTPMKSKAKEDIVKGVSATTDRIAELLDIPGNILANHVFVPQAETSKSLFLPESERIAQFTKLLPAVDVAEARSEACRTELNRFPELVILTPSLEIKRQLRVAEKELEQAEDDVKEQERVLSELDLAWANEIAAKQEAADKARRSLNLLKQSLAAAQEEYAAAAKRLKEVSSEHDELESDLRDLGPDYAAAKQELERLRGIKKEATRYADLVAEQRALKSPGELAAAPFDRKDIEKRDTQLSDRRVRLGIIKDRLEKLQDQQGTCPVCGADLSDWEDRVAELKAEVAKEEPEIKHLYEKLVADRQELSKWEREAATHAAAVKTYERDKARIEKGLAETDSLEAVENIDDTIAELNEGVTSYEESEKTLKSLASTLTTVTRREAKAKAELDALNSRKGDFDDAVEAAPSADALARAGKIRTSYEAATVAVGEARGVAKAAKREVEKVQEDLAKTIELEKKVANVTEYRKLLEAVRQNLHRSALPRVVSQMYMARLNRLCGRYLEAFNSPFAVRVHDNLAIDCFMPNGYVCPATRLSGGQKCVLSTVFRFATNRLFANKLGLLVLDEPTEFMDKDNIAHMGELIEGIREESVSANMQTLIITHAAPLMPSFTDVIEIGG